MGYPKSMFQRGNSFTAKDNKRRRSSNPLGERSDARSQSRERPELQARGPSQNRFSIVVDGSQWPVKLRHSKEIEYILITIRTLSQLRRRATNDC